MNRLLIAAALCLVFCIPMYAQDYPKAEIYGGYQLIMDEELNEEITFSRNSVFDDYTRLHGFNAAFEYNIRSWIGIVAELGHGRTSPVLGNFTEFAPFPRSSSEFRRNQTSFLFGPRFSYRGGRFRVSGHALFGGNRVGRGSTLITEFEDGSRDFFENSRSYTDFATAFGGGVDISLGKLVSIRPVQLDLLSTYRSYASYLDINQHQFRYSGGVVIKLGS